MDMLELTFSVVIPALNEESHIGFTLDAVRAAALDVQLIVADGGSSDKTVEIARNRGAIVCHSPRGRGLQCNAGAGLATGDIVLFLHADTVLPPHAFETLAEHFGNRSVSIGTFGLRFARRHWMLWFIERLSDLKLGWLRFGDSGIAVRRDFFRSLGGFPEQPLFEDLEFLHRASHRSHLRRFPLAVTTSARRFSRNGVVRQALADLVYTARYLAGTPAERLAATYESNSRRTNGRALLMMVRRPWPGKVKSRLAEGVGHNAAAAIYSFCAERLFSAARALPAEVEKFIYCTETRDIGSIDEWSGRQFIPLAQPAGSLDRRLDIGFSTMFKRGAGRVVIAASDVPDISVDLLEKAFMALEGHDVVIGPSPDGGYYLIGLRKRQPQLFKGIAWSSGTVLGQTVNRAVESGLSVHLLPPVADIDTMEDWENWLAASKDSLTLPKEEIAGV